MVGPLSGTRVLDFTWVLAGPYATMVLADLGAEVIKVEPPNGGDFSRHFGPYFDGDVSHYFLSINRGKKSITVNLKTKRGNEIIRDLVKQADVLVENFVPGTMARLGLAYEQLREINPRLIYASASGFGHSGPYMDRPAYDVIVQAMAGTMSLTGEPGRPSVRVGYSIGDMGASLFTVIGVLAALNERERSGLGQHVDIAMLDSQVALLENAVTRYFCSGKVPAKIGSRHPSIAPFQAYRSKDGEFVLGAANDRQWQAVCSALGLRHLLEDERFLSNDLRVTHADEMEAEIEAVTTRMTTDECLARLMEAQVPCGPVQTIDKVVQDPQLAAREMFVEVEHPRAGRLKVTGSPLKLSRTPGRVERASPDLGEHTAEVLGELLGYSPAEVEALREQGIV